MRDEEVLEWLARARAGIRRDGSLPKGEVAEAVTAYQANGRALLSDALLLAANGRTNRASALTVLALEELAKIPMLVDTFRRHAHGFDPQAWPDYWKVSGRHKDKQKRILLYGELIRSQMDGDPLHGRRLYRYYSSSDLFQHLDSFKQANLYVDLRLDGVHAPCATNEDLEALDYLLTYAQERCDSFESWHVTTVRSADLLAMSNDDLGRWTTSYQLEEVQGDLLYQLSGASASQVPNYALFNDYVRTVRKNIQDTILQNALLHLAHTYRERVSLSRNLARYYARQIGAFKLLLGLESLDGGVFGQSFKQKMEERLLPEAT
jgi:AbiV family abortive infection protein